MNASFDPRQSLLQVYHRWWLVALLGILGGLGGWLLYQSRPPVYESAVEFALNIDTGKTGPLTERTLDQFQQAFGRIFYTAPIIDETLRRAALLGIDLDAQSFRSITYQEWHRAVWVYTVRSENPELAQTLAKIWGEVAVEALDRAGENAREAADLQERIDALATCADESAAGALTCSLPAGLDFEQEIADLSARRDAALEASLGLTAALHYEQTAQALLSDTPVTIGQAARVFFGALSGMVVGIWMIHLKWFRKPDLPA